MALQCSDTFIVLPPLTTSGSVIFGKNSGRPQDEVQEVVYEPSRSYSEGERLQCTYIEVEQVLKTKAVFLSKPAWMWGAEMGANECNVVIGNEEVITNVDTEAIREEHLLGQDLVRLGLERASTADEAVSVITSLLEMYGQGGRCSDTDSQLVYHNSFIIVDPKEAWIVETAGKLWVAEKITGGYCNISNSLRINNSITIMSDNVKSYAVDNCLWDGQGDFKFATIFGVESNNLLRLETGQKLLQNLTASNNFDVDSMFKILRNNDSKICRSRHDPFPTTASQVSVLCPGKLSCHWVTGTPDPSLSVFKPFVFTPNVKISRHTVSPKFENDPAKVVPRFTEKVDRKHNLYRLHEAAVLNRIEIVSQLQKMEEGCVQEMKEVTCKFKSGQNLDEFDELLKDVVETEIKFYK